MAHSSRISFIRNRHQCFLSFLISLSGRRLTQNAGAADGMKRFLSIGILAAFLLPNTQPFLFSEQDALIKKIVSARPSYGSSIPHSTDIIGGVVPHHAVLTFPLIASLYAHMRSTRKGNPTFVILGPDHFNKAHSHIITTKNSFATSFGTLDSQASIIDALVTKRLATIDDKAFVKEHAIHSQTAFIKKYFPDADIVALLYRASAPLSQAKTLGAYLARQKKDIIVIASVDFSHYHPARDARKIDMRSLQALRSIDAANLSLIDADSPGAIATLLTFLKSRKGRMIDSHVYNTADFSPNSTNTTGYIIAMFSASPY